MDIPVARAKPWQLRGPWSRAGKLWGSAHPWSWGRAEGGRALFCSGFYLRTEFGACSPCSARVLGPRMEGAGYGSSCTLDWSQAPGCAAPPGKARSRTAPAVAGQLPLHSLKYMKRSGTRGPEPTVLSEREVGAGFPGHACLPAVWGAVKPLVGFQVSFGKIRNCVVSSMVFTVPENT